MAFTAAVFTILWLLQSFYNNILKSRTRSAAQKIAEADGNFDTIDTAARDNSLLVYLTDTEGKILYSTDEHKGEYGEKNITIITTAKNLTEMIMN